MVLEEPFGSRPPLFGVQGGGARHKFGFELLGAERSTVELVEEAPQRGESKGVPFLLCGGDAFGQDFEESITKKGKCPKGVGILMAEDLFVLADAKPPKGLEGVAEGRG